MSKRDEVMPYWCPHCGSLTAPAVLSSYEFTDPDAEYEEQFVVCCRIDERGCGATSAYTESRDDSLEKWNTRATGPNIAHLTTSNRLH